MNICHNDYEKIVKLENLFRAWQKFKIGKIRKREIMEFERNLEDNLFSLHRCLSAKSYQHSKYQYFIIKDPKKRNIHKANIKDRIVHQILYDYLREIYEPIFIDDSYSSRIGKGTHKAVSRLQKFALEIYDKNNGQCFALKCDIKRYFENIDHTILIYILKQKITDVDILNLLVIIIRSFNGNIGKSLPLGNITSQIFANIYLNELDQFVKKELRLKYYLRYNDDFIILDANQTRLFDDISRIKKFVENRILLKIPKNKITFRKLSWGIDFCGYVVLPNAILLRQKTKKSMIKNIYRKWEKLRVNQISFGDFSKIISSYFGLLKHCDSYNLRNAIKNRHIYGEII